MARTKSGSEFIKKTAVVLSMLMAFRAVSALPDGAVKDGACVASAETNTAALYQFKANDCTFYYSINRETPVNTAIIEDVTIQNDGGIVEVPSVVKYGSSEYEVIEIADRFLYSNKEVREVTVPEGVISIGENFASRSSVEKITLPDSLEHVGMSLGSYSSDLTTLNYTGTKVESVGTILSGITKLYNEKDALCFGNWLIKYKSPDNVSYLKIADLSDGDVKIDKIATGALSSSNNYVSYLDLEGIVYIGNSNFSNYRSLTVIVNDDDVKQVGYGTFTNTPWEENSRRDGLARIGGHLRYYKTDGKIIDFTKGELAGITNVQKDALADCANADTLICTSDCVLNDRIFYVADPSNLKNLRNLLPERSTYKIKDIYLDGKELKFSSDDPAMTKWVSKNCYALTGTEWRKINITAKTKALLEQLDMPYYGLNNYKVGTLTATEEFYSVLKIHELISTFAYDYHYHCTLDAFQVLGIANCTGYATLTSYLLECAGVRSLYQSSVGLGNHAWNEVQIGGEWFELDGGWDAQLGHHYEWFALSTANSDAKDASGTKPYAHQYGSATEGWFLDSSKSTPGKTIAKRTIGDINGDETRDQKDADLLWMYLKKESGVINGKAADINFDGVIDITDAVLLQNFVTGTAIDPDDFPTDGLAPGFKVVFVNTNDFDYNNYTYLFTDRNGYINLPEVMFKAPDGKKFSGWNVGKAGETVKIKNPYTVIQPIWKNESSSDENLQTGDVDGNGVIDISDVSKLINHINGVKALDDEEMLRSDVNRSNTVDISDAAEIINHINGVKAITDTV